MKRIYIAGPYTQGDVAQNVKRALDLADQLICCGYVPYIPHLSHFLHMAHPQDYETWMTIGLMWLEKCDAVLRLVGKSTGADREVAVAKNLCIPVFYTIRELQEALS